MDRLGSLEYDRGLKSFRRNPRSFRPRHSFLKPTASFRRKQSFRIPRQTLHPSSSETESSQSRPHGWKLLKAAVTAFTPKIQNALERDPRKERTQEETKQLARWVELNHAEFLQQIATKPEERSRIVHKIAEAMHVMRLPKGAVITRQGNSE